MQILKGKEDRKVRKLSAAVVVCLVALFSTVPTLAAPVTLQHNNSLLVIDPENPIQGMFNWTVDNVDHLYQQWWWYRIGNGPEQSISTLQLASSDVLGDRLLIQKYCASDFDLEVTWTLTGGAANSGFSMVKEGATITNKSTGNLYISLYEYSDFDILGTAENDFGTHVNANKVKQFEFPVLVEESVTQTPSRWQMDGPGNILALLNDSDKDNLTNQYAFYGPGNVAWAFQWDFVIGPGSSAGVSKDKSISSVIPEWNSLLLAAIGMVGTIGIRRRRRLG